MLKLMIVRLWLFFFEFNSGLEDHKRKEDKIMMDEVMQNEFNLFQIKIFLFCIIFTHLVKTQNSNFELCEASKQKGSNKLSNIFKKSEAFYPKKIKI